MVNLTALFKAKAIKDAFVASHPRFFPFLKAVQGGAMKSGTVVQITATTKEGKTYEHSLRLTAQDIALYHEIMAALGTPVAKE